MMPTRIPSSRGEKTRRAILDGSYRLIIRQGFAATSMREIARQSHVALGGIYNHFGSKEEIFRAIIEERHPFFQMIPLLNSVQGATVEEYVRNAARTLVAQLGRHPEFLNLMLVEIIEFKSSHVPLVFKKLLPSVMPVAEHIASLEGHLRPIPPFVLARAFLGIQMGPGPWDEMPLWLGLPEAGRTHEPEQYLGDHPRGEHSWAVLRASSFKSRLGHMDQLHLDLWWRGMNIAQDAGTYLYNAEPPWDNPLTATRVHNTVTVDGREQMTRGGRFLTLGWFPAFSKISIEGEGDLLQRVMAHHEGYPGVRHERTVSVHAGDRWVVEDRLIARGRHTYRLHWLLEEGDEDQEKWRIENRDSRFEASGHGLERGKRKEERGWKVEEGEGGGEVRIQQGEGWIAVRMRAGPAAEASLSVVRAGELVYGKREMLPYEGWVSPTYGVKIPALSVMLEVHARRPVTLTTEFLFPHP